MDQKDFLSVVTNADEGTVDGYEGVTVAGIAVVRRDGGTSVLLAQRAYDETDDEAVRETWEMPGGHLQCVTCGAQKAKSATRASAVTAPAASETATASVGLNLGVDGRELVSVDAVGLSGVDGGGADPEKDVISPRLSGEMAESQASAMRTHANALNGVTGVVDGGSVRDGYVREQVQGSMQVGEFASDVGTAVASRSGGPSVEEAIAASVDSSGYTGGKQGESGAVVHDASVPPGLTHEHEWEEPFAAAAREFTEEIGVPLPEGEVVNGWRSEDGHYQGFVYEVEGFPALADVPGSEEVQAVGWYSPEEAAAENLRPEVAAMDWSIFEVSGNEDEMDDVAAATQEPETEGVEEIEEPGIESLSELIEFGYVPIHGVLAPEDTESGDMRGFNEGSMTQRPYRLPFMWQREQNNGHDKAVTVGSVDRLMRKDGLIHFEGLLMASATAGEFAELLSFFGRYGVSVDGDKSSLDSGKTRSTDVVWYESVRAVGLTAVSIPAFTEAYVAFGPHPEMPTGATETAALAASGDLVTFDRGPGWVTHPKETRRIHAYWTQKGQPGYTKIGWGTPGDFTRARALIGEKIGKNSPEDMKYLNQIIAQWHFDALGYWPGELGKPGNAPDTPENRRRAARHAASANEGIEMDAEGYGWEAVLTSSGRRAAPPLAYFSRHPETGATVIEDPDENGFRRTYGYAGEWGVCHIGYDGHCEPVPDDPDGGEFRSFHLGRTRTAAGYIPTGVITYKVDHRDAKRILTETAEQQHYDNIAHAWAAVRLGVDENGIWFSGVVLPNVSDEDCVLIEAAGQVSGEWKYGALRGLQSVNIPGFPVARSSAEYDENGNLVALAASALTKPFTLAEPDACKVEDCETAATMAVWDNPSEPSKFCTEHVATAAEHACAGVSGNRQRMSAEDLQREAEAAERFAALRQEYLTERMAALREDGIL